GMILVTGPTGSGKSPTLYTTLNAVARPEINVITVEDPLGTDAEGTAAPGTGAAGAGAGHAVSPDRS
ncbi:ATPase, T2SS/T4P/T4SS family, partial [Curtobacterium sp. CT11-45]